MNVLPRPAVASRLDLAAVQDDERAHQREAEAEAAVGAVGILIALDEQLEHARQQSRAMPMPSSATSTTIWLVSR